MHFSNVIYKRSAKSLALFLIYFYQIFLRPWLNGNCRFHPTCSEYALEAFERHSPGKALWLTAARLWKCRPFSEFGMDPVPK